KIIEVDTPNGSHGPEHIYWIAEIAGLYQLEVRSLNNKAATGRYEVKVMEMRLAISEDTFRIAAQKAFGEGMQLYAQKTADSLERAISKYEEALNNWRASNDQAGQATALSRLGLADYNAGKPKKALELYYQVLPLMRAIKDRPGEANTLN